MSFWSLSSSERSVEDPALDSSPYRVRMTIKVSNVITYYVVDFTICAMVVAAIWSCSRVCVAIRLARRRACPLATVG